MTKEAAAVRATELIVMTTGFNREEAAQVFADEFFKIHGDATRAEHDKIEKFIGTAKFQQVRAMIARAQAKWMGK
ncbi:hypothetical protein UFOVP558_35 [uncultured Caudovirales phage]|uniref:Uncharacterized protein n=1 Tax=uncultured Caudovirales phage TaxID=2100421 RepID=A0A6J5MV03_9CAUD|nr:hypothetical protein UFOVP558_35 [uncultured Caudovirales phage]